MTILKKTGIVVLVAILFACNNSATVTQPNDLDRTKNNDTNTLVSKDSTGAQNNGASPDTTKRQ
jgi:hypothetical protein